MAYEASIPGACSCHGLFMPGLPCPPVPVAAGWPWGHHPPPEHRVPSPSRLCSEPLDAPQNRQLGPWACPALLSVGCEQQPPPLGSHKSKGPPGRLSLLMETRTLLHLPASAQIYPQIGEIFPGRQPVPDITLFLWITVFRQALFPSR